jgi:S-adenosylmethionine synthetase
VRDDTVSGDFLFTSESVTEGHPDKMADQISDAVLDFIIQRDPKARVACETMVTNGICLISGEMKTTTYAPIQEIVRDVIRDIGYTDASYGFDYRSAGVLNAIGEQSPDINQGVDRDSGELGAGDQGIMFGYACDETKELMPLAISLAHKLTKNLSMLRKKGVLPFLRPDGKAQVSVEYINGKPKRVDSIVISTQHSPDVPYSKLKDAIIEELIYPTIPKELLNDDIKYYINPTGRFVIGGPQGDAGLTGRKIVVDTYGGYAPHGGGAFSGKDPTKVDRSAAYMARYIAKNLVKSKVCSKVTIQLAYAIGVASPVSVYVNTHQSSKVDEKRVEEVIKEIFDLKVKSIISTLNLLSPIYKKTACYGHFGREEEGFLWEKTDKTEEIKSLLL